MNAGKGWGECAGVMSCTGQRDQNRTHKAAVAVKSVDGSAVDTEEKAKGSGRLICVLVEVCVNSFLASFSQ